MPIIDVKALVKTFPGPVEAVRGIDLDVVQGTIFGLLGPNGAGKSSTVRILATLSQPTAGRAFVAGHDVVGDSDGIRRAIGYVAQASSVDVHLTGTENLYLQGRLFGLGGRDLAQRVETLLQLFDLEDAASRRTKGWSGGMKRRLDLAMGLIHKPKILFLDEPSSGLDPESRSVMWREVKRLSDEEGMTIFLTTHYLEEADRLADQVAIIDKGLIVARGTPSGLKDGLNGDLVSLTFSGKTDTADASTRLRALAMIDTVTVSGQRVDVRTKDGARSIPAIVGALSGLDLQDVAMSRPSLDDVYLSVTGKQFALANAEGHEGAGGRKGAAA